MIDVDRVDVATLSVGDELEVEVTDSLDRTDFVRYAGASGDFNPLHVDEVYARNAGYDSVVGHGMLVCGYLSQVVSGWLGVQFLSTLDVRFVSKVRPGDAVIVRCEVVSCESQDDETAADVAVEAVDRSGRTLAEGSVTAVAD